MNKNFWNRLPLVSGSLIILLSLAVMIGWIVEARWLIQILPVFAPMPFNTAVCFFFSAIAMIAFSFESKKTAAVCTFVICLFSGLTLAEYYFHHNYGIDELFVKGYVHTKTTYPGRMSVLSTHCFVLVAIVLILNFAHSTRQIFRRIASFLATAIVSISTVAFVGYLVGADVAYSWVGSTAMAVHTATGFFFLGIGLFFLSRRDEKKRLYEQTYLPILVTLGHLTITLWVAQVLVLSEAQKSSRILRSELLSSEKSIRMVEKDYVEAIIRLGDRSVHFTKEQWSEDAKNYLQHMPYVQSITWYSSKRKVQWSTSHSLQKDKRIGAMESDVYGERGTEFIDNSLNKSEKYGLLAYSPMIRKEPFGLLLVEVDLEKFLSGIIAGTELNAQIEVLGKSGVLLSNLSNVLSGKFEESSFSLNGMDWVLRAYPTPRTLALVKTNIPLLFLFFGCLISALAGLIVVFWQKFQRAHLRFKLIAEGSASGMWDWESVNEDKEYWSPSFYRTLGYEVGEIPSSLETFSNLLHPEDREKTFNALDAHFRDGQAFMVEYRLKKKNGEYHWYLGTGEVARDLEGKPSRMAGGIIDIHARKVAEEELKKKNDEIRELTERMAFCLAAVSTGTWDWNLKTRVLEWDDNICRLYGVEPGTFEKTSAAFEELVYPEDRARVAAEVMSAVDGKTNYETKFRIMPKNDPNSIRWIGAKGSVYRDGDGVPFRMVGVCWDISDLVQQQEVFTTALEFTPDGKIIVDELGVIQSVNLAAQEIFGYSKKELIGKKIEVLVPVNLREKHVELRTGFSKDVQRKVMAKGRVVHGVTKSGEEVPLETGLTNFSTVQGAFVLVSVVDISEKLEIQRKIEENTEELARSNRELEQFAYVASHDLQTPLRGIYSYSQMLQQELHLTDPDHKKWMGYIMTCAKEMQELINDLLMFSRVSRQQIQSNEIDLHSLVEQIVDFPGFAASDSKIIIGELPFVPGNQTLLRQLFQNLIQNALKFKRQGVPSKVEISYRETGEFFEFCVKDNGIGIDTQHFDRVFQIFQRLHESGKFEGSGIGLAICKKVVEMHGGKIWVESEEEKGTCFYFTLPKKSRIVGKKHETSDKSSRSIAR